MASREHVPQTERVCQKDDKQVQELKGRSVSVPDSWKLTKQQQEFIELFSADDHKKQ